MTDLPLNNRDRGPLSNDARAMILFTANMTNPVVAYLLLVFFGMFGGHNFYLKRNGIAAAQLILTITIVGIAVTLIWLIVDACLIPGIVRDQNNALAVKLGA